MNMVEVDELHYELLKLEQYTPHYTQYFHDFKHENKFFEAFIRYKLNKISGMCCDILIDGSGKCNWIAIEELQRRGFYVGPGERDGFGWLTGVLGTLKGDIVYG